MRHIRFLLSATLITGTVASAASAAPFGNPFTRQVGILALNPNQAGAVSIGGNGFMHVPRLLVNSSSVSAVECGGSGTLQTRMVQVNGHASFTGSMDFTGFVISNAGPVMNPFEDLEMPDPDSYPPDQGHLRLQGGNHTVGPGYYSGGIEIRGNANVTFLPGEYIIGGLSALNGSISGDGVVFINIDGAIDLGGNAAVSLIPPNSGDYEGLVIVQDPANSNPIDLRGGSDFRIHGAIVATGAHVNVTGNGGVEGAAPFFGDLMVVDTVAVGGNGTIRVGDWLTAGNLPTIPLFD